MKSAGSLRAKVTTRRRRTPGCPKTFAHGDDYIFATGPRERQTATLTATILLRCLFPNQFVIPAKRAVPGGNAHVQRLLPLHLFEAHSFLLSHGLPAGQFGEHAGAVHVPATQFFVAQSEFAPHCLPLAHVGEHPGTRQMPAGHLFEPQSEFAPQTDPFPQLGEHAGG